MNRPCLGDPLTGAPCGIPSPDTRCPVHTRQRDRLHHNPIYDTPRWRRLAKTVKARHIRTQGYMCPGYGTPRHLAPRLSADHIVALVDGGQPFDEGNVQVLCVSCNSRKDGASRAR